MKKRYMILLMLLISQSVIAKVCFKNLKIYTDKNGSCHDACRKYNPHGLLGEAHHPFSGTCGYAHQTWKWCDCYEKKLVMETTKKYPFFKWVHKKKHCMNTGEIPLSASCHVRCKAAGCVGVSWDKHVTRKHCYCHP